MSTQFEGREELDEVEDLDDEEEEVDDPEEVEAQLASVTPADDDDDESDEASLEELLAQRARRTPEEPEDADDIMTLASERETRLREPLPSRVIPIRDRQEFVCNRCHLVKARSQLADAERGLCRDCV